YLYYSVLLKKFRPSGMTNIHVGEGGVIVGGFCSVTDGNKTAALLKLYFLMGILCSLAFNLVYYSPALLH
ncbi:MAG: hypothetical protein AAGK05_17800, partial [Pseudomonadota bacterium]